MLKRNFIQYFTLMGLLAIALCELFVTIGMHWGLLAWSSKVDYQVFTILPLFALALLQLYYNGRLQKTEFIRKYAENFFTNESIYSAFHELVYQYTDKDFELIDRIIKEKEEANLLSDQSPRPMFVPLNDVSPPRGEGKRLYHPKYFQRSLEERPHRYVNRIF